MRKMASWVLGVLAACLTAAVIAAAVLCPSQKPLLLDAPEEAVTCAAELMEAVCNGDFSKAETFLYGNAKLGADRQPSDSAGSLIWEAYVQSLDYQLVGELYPTESGLAQDVKIISLELDSVTKNLDVRAQQILTETIAEAEDVSQLYDENNEYREELVMGILRQAVQDALEEDTRYAYQVIPLRLVYSGEEWNVVADRNFLNAISGGIIG